MNFKVVSMIESFLEFLSYMFVIGLVVTATIGIHSALVSGLKSQDYVECYKQYPDPHIAERKVCIDVVGRRY